MGETAKKILVTGGTGFTGSHLVRRLLSRGHEVSVLDNQRGRFYDELLRLGARITIGSVTDRDLVERAVEGQDVVQHLAAAFRKVDLPKRVYWQVNVDGTRFLLDASLRRGVAKFVYTSTQGVHGHVANPPGNEESPIAPADYYQYTKYQGEVVCQEYIRKGLDVTILRPTAMYGPGDPERWLMLFKRVASGRFLMFGDGRTTYHPLYIDNLIDAYELAMERPEATGQTYLIGDAHYYTLDDLVQAVADVLGIKVSIVHLPFWPAWAVSLACEIACKPLHISPPLFRRRIDWFRQSRAFDIGKARRELGYEPKVDLRTGLRRTGLWYREQGYIRVPRSATGTA